MRILIITFLLYGCFFATAQVDIIDLCVVFEIDTPTKTDLRNATFDLPFPAGRSDKNISWRLYLFDIKSNSTINPDLTAGLNVKAIRPYVYGEVLADNEIAFQFSNWPEEFKPDGLGAIIGSFASNNGYSVKTDHLIFDNTLDLPQQLIDALNLSFSSLGSGQYQLYQKDIKM